MTQGLHYIYESILDDIDVQDDSIRAADTLVSNVNKANQYPDPYIDKDYDFELEIYTPTIKLRSAEKIIALIRKWIDNLDTVMQSSRQITKHTRAIFYSKYDSRLRDIVKDDDLIREPAHKNMYGTALYVRFNHNFKTASQIMKFVC